MRDGVARRLPHTLKFAAAAEAVMEAIVVRVFPNERDARQSGTGHDGCWHAAIVILVTGDFPTRRTEDTSDCSRRAAL